METIALKKTVLKYVEEADARLLEMMLSLAESYENNDSSVLSESDYHEMDNRRLNHLKEKSESYSWEEVQQRAKNALKK
ncbi:hypothetical protein LDL76_06390 [Salegentibacter mishustinae]|jgi:hypothetical protein|uniref:Uncharacterized protein n=1 Tax=Salegentibacter agarivorans TaxID=345907 RepID=A0A1I2NI67_9FLAO|nr:MULTISPECIES: hypothetical protein [Salegentibacter]APS37907.1 hypothetical protein AO058_02990 [Salegentibacter sp. T436]MBO2543334.1 hypothetical protein [Salegentibacter sp. BDJ18]UBZ08337.1 hypothetical protein LDL76_06390 [Salegentibacter mishustinae]SFG02499.1 hypothetical protein SAMN04488033_12136 [Salegentibacter agarivorans]|tara:strand:+ start:384 stop:620 length:237 start_codon:yes stop_codon:yes gene_type:complete